MKALKTIILGVAICGMVGASMASAAPIVAGTYQLQNHPDASLDPPPYGARLDELYDVTAGADNFTFDFEHASSNMQLDYNGSNSIHIYGDAYGGRDIGGDYDMNPVTGLPYLGVYSFDFLYNVGVGLVPTDDDVWAMTATNSNFGTVSTPLSDTFNLFDVADGNYTFRLGDENDDLGHRGFPGISGWGWLGVQFGDNSGTLDWIFTAVPEPSTGLLLVLGLGVISRRRR